MMLIHSREADNHMEFDLKILDSLDYIEKNLSENISLEDLAKRACMSKFYYHRLFHKSVGETVSRYISRKRMESAARELMETDRPIIDIALKYQYGSQESFSWVFKKPYALTTGNYRKVFACGRQIIPFHCNSQPKAMAA